MSVAENTGAPPLAAGSWQVDLVHSAVELRIRHMIATVKGRFRDFDGAIDAGEVPSVAGTIRVASLETLDARRDDGDDRRFLVPGELTIKDVTRPVLLDGVFQGFGIHPEGGERIAFALQGELDRTDLGLVAVRAE
jgi:polyisoprenoid-binding protein YceI